MRLGGIHHVTCITADAEVVEAAGNHPHAAVTTSAAQAMT
jgi:hypothetical protein